MVATSSLSSVSVKRKQGDIYSHLFFVCPDLACLVLTLNFLAVLKDRALWKELFRHCSAPAWLGEPAAPELPPLGLWVPGEGRLCRDGMSRGCLGSLGCAAHRAPSSALTLLSCCWGMKGIAAGDSSVISRRRAALSAGRAGSSTEGDPRTPSPLLPRTRGTCHLTIPKLSSSESPPEHSPALGTLPAENPRWEAARGGWQPKERCGERCDDKSHWHIQPALTNDFPDTQHIFPACCLFRILS